MSVLELQEVAYSYDKKKKVLKGIDVQMETGKVMRFSSVWVR